LYKSNKKLNEKIIRYKGRDITVLFTVDRCIHVAECLKGAPKVFDAYQRPWVDPDAEPADKVAEIILRCPTGALHFLRSDSGWEESAPEENQVILNSNGPYYLFGNIELLSETGERLLQDTRIGLCRCGKTRHQPFCDGVHALSDYQDAGILRDQKEDSPAFSEDPSKLMITLQKNGPLILNGFFRIIDAQELVAYKGIKAALCRCGASKKSPFCDGRHIEIGFKSQP
jgi:CDGSH-type Zn-finger protein/uncharacterized Fe-S cluster protein YjdI